MASNLPASASAPVSALSAVLNAQRSPDNVTMTVTPDQINSPTGRTRVIRRVAPYNTTAEGINSNHSPIASPNSPTTEMEEMEVVVTPLIGSISNDLVGGLSADRLTYDDPTVSPAERSRYFFYPSLTENIERRVIRGQREITPAVYCMVMTEPKMITLDPPQACCLSFDDNCEGYEPMSEGIMPACGRCKYPVCRYCYTNYYTNTIRRAESCLQKCPLDVCAVRSQYGMKKVETSPRVEKIITPDITKTIKRINPITRENIERYNKEKTFLRNLDLFKSQQELYFSHNWVTKEEADNAEDIVSIYIPREVGFLWNKERDAITSYAQFYNCLYPMFKDIYGNSFTPTDFVKLRHNFYIGDPIRRRITSIVGLDYTKPMYIYLRRDDTRTYLEREVCIETYESIQERHFRYFSNKNNICKYPVKHWYSLIDENIRAIHSLDDVVEYVDYNEGLFYTGFSGLPDDDSDYDEDDRSCIYLHLTNDATLYRNAYNLMIEEMGEDYYEEIMGEDDYEFFEVEFPAVSENPVILCVCPHYVY